MASHRGDSVNMMGTRVRKLPIIPLSDAPPLSAGELASVDTGRLTTNRSDLQDNDLSDLLVSFYAALADDPLLAPYFASLDMSTHMPRIAAFWSTILFHTGRYSGNAFRPHLSMPGLTAEHFASWVATLEDRLDARFVGENVERMKDMAQRIAHSMQLRLGIMPTTLLRPVASE
jgi:hemoglobin